MDDDDVVQILLQIKNEKKQKRTTPAQEYEIYNARKDFDDRILGIFTAWLNNHKNNPYPTVDEKKQLCNATGCSIRQVNDWFANARRRKLKHSGFKKTRAKKNQTTATKFVRPVLNYHIYFFASHASRARRPRGVARFELLVGPSGLLRSSRRAIVGPSGLLALAPTSSAFLFF